jgi:hypothetical protein
MNTNPTTADSPSAAANEPERDNNPLPRTKGRAPQEDYNSLLPPQIDRDGNPVLGEDLPDRKAQDNQK